jgi:hypothetical protein
MKTSPLSLDEQRLAARERRTRLIVFTAAALVLSLTLGVCATFASILPMFARLDADPTRIKIAITGTITLVAGMPLPADAVIIRQTYSSNGGVLTYTTHHRPQQLYNFYFYLVAQEGGWNAGSRPEIGPDRAVFRFYPGTVPRWTVFTVRCPSEICEVQMEYLSATN